MDIQIKYREPDRSKQVHSMILDWSIRRSPGYTAKDAAQAIDKLYKEESKEIESVTIVSPFGVNKHLFQATISKGKHGDSAILSIPNTLKTDKVTLSKIIELLQQIESQMER